MITAKREKKTRQFYITYSFNFACELICAGTFFPTVRELKKKNEKPFNLNAVDSLSACVQLRFLSIF